jgi:hypothetical protein
MMNIIRYMLMFFFSPDNINSKFSFNVWNIELEDDFLIISAGQRHMNMQALCHTKEKIFI